MIGTKSRTAPLFEESQDMQEERQSQHDEDGYRDGKRGVIPVPQKLRCAREGEQLLNMTAGAHDQEQ